jgi:prepilin-type N-terminal cleavage/methylation domain-containing protein
MKPGFSLVEVILVLSVFAILIVIAVPRFTSYQDQMSVHAATMDVVSALGRARSVAFERSTRAAVTFDSLPPRLTVVSYSDTLDVRPLDQLYGVRLATSRDSVTYAANAMGFGVSNARIIVSRGAAAETVTVSRLGRVRR